MLATELSAGGRLRVVPGENVARARKELDLGSTHSYSHETLDKIRKNLGVDYVVFGSYLDTGKESGGEIRLDVRLQDARSGEIVAAMPETGTEGKLIQLLSVAGTDLREKLGVGDIAGSEITRVAATIPKDPTAARLYAEGLASLRELNPVAARDTLLKAVAVEPDHPLIHAALADAWSQLGYDEKSRAEARLAASLSAKLPQSDQLWVEGRFRESTHEWDKAIDVYRTLLGFYPDNVEYGLRLATTQTNAGRQKDALETIAALRRLPPPASSDPRIDLAEADADDISGDFQKEKALALRALDEARSRGASLLGARAQYSAAWAALNLGEMADAANFAEGAQATYVAAGDRNGEANMLRTLGSVNLMQGNLSAALHFYQDSLRLSREVGNRYGEAAALNQIATTLERQGKHEAALGQYQQSLAILHEIGNSVAEGTALNNIANILWARGDLAGARRMYEQAITLGERLGDRSRESGSIINIAHILVQQGDLKAAREKLATAIPLAQQIGAKSILAEAANSLGEISTAEAKFDEAHRQYEEARSEREELGEHVALAETWMSTAELLLAEARPAEGEDMASKALAVFQKEDAQDEQFAATAVLANSLLALGKNKDARKAIDNLRPGLAKIENTYVRLNFLVAAARAETASGELSEARADLESVLRTTSAMGFFTTQLKARLALAELERAYGNASKTQIDLAALEKDARAPGFVVIARQAASLRSR